MVVSALWLRSFGETTSSPQAPTSDATGAVPQSRDGGPPESCVATVSVSTDGCADQLTISVDGQQHVVRPGEEIHPTIACERPVRLQATAEGCASQDAVIGARVGEPAARHFALRTLERGIVRAVHADDGLSLVGVEVTGPLGTTYTAVDGWAPVDGAWLSRLELRHPGLMAENVW